MEFLERKALELISQWNIIATHLWLQHVLFSLINIKPIFSHQNVSIQESQLPEVTEIRLNWCHTYTASLSVYMFQWLISLKSLHSWKALFPTNLTSTKKNHKGLLLTINVMNCKRKIDCYWINKCNHCQALSQLIDSNMCAALCSITVDEETEKGICQAW